MREPQKERKGFENVGDERGRTIARKKQNIFNSDGVRGMVSRKKEKTTIFTQTRLTIKRWRTRDEETENNEGKGSASELTRRHSFG